MINIQEDANPNCKECHGEGEVYQWFVNHKEKLLAMDWAYCLTCFPGSTCFYEYDQRLNWEWIEHDEVNKYEQNGYKILY